MDNFFHNPIALLFVSYAIGASLTPMLQKTAWYKREISKNYLSDKTTNNLGVLLLGKIIIATSLRYFNQNLYLKGRPKKEDLLKIKQVMHDAEIGHLIGFYVLLLLCLIYIFLGKDWRLILGIFIMNIILNLYLVFLQQYNKRRVNRLLKIFEKE